MNKINIKSNTESLTSCARFNVRTIYVTSRTPNTEYYFSIGVAFTILMGKSIIYNNGKLIADSKWSECKMREASGQQKQNAILFKLNCLSVNKMINFIKLENINNRIQINNNSHGYLFNGRNWKKMKKENT